LIVGCLFEVVEVVSWCIGVTSVVFIVHVGVVYVGVIEFVDDFSGDIVPVVWGFDIDVCLLYFFYRDG
jgi:hypothetical protein